MIFRVSVRRDGAWIPLGTVKEATQEAATASACDRLLILMTHGDTLRDDIAIICIDLNGPGARPSPPDAGRGSAP